jgi:hypothetical protein
LKKEFLVIVFIIFLLILSSCATTNDKIEPLKTEVVNFDMQTARQMIEKVEKIISGIAVKDNVSRHEYNQFIASITDTLDGYKGVGWSYIFFNNIEIENNKIDTLRLQKKIFYPTIYHRDIDVVSAKITSTFYQNKFFNDNLLAIREEYFGKDTILKNWFREYTYKKNDNGNWIFYGFVGQLNFSGENITPDYLKFK